MNIGIIVAMDKELQLLLPLIGQPETVEADGCEFHLGRIGSHRVCVGKCGIGKVNAALGTLALIQLFNPQLIINTGVAGGTGRAAQVLNVVAATAVGYHDVWCGPGTTPGQAAGCPALFKAPERLLALPALTADPQVKFGIVASGDIFVDRRATVDRVLTLYPDAVGIDMESAAIAQTCYRHGIDFLCLRVISDTPGEVADNGAQYASFWEAAPRRAFDIVSRLLNEID